MKSNPLFFSFVSVIVKNLFSGAFMDAISGMEFDFVASGHYAKIVHASTEQLDEPSVLELSKDMVCFYIRTCFLEPLTLFSFVKV